jgi:hypothetical protein
MVGEVIKTSRAKNQLECWFEGDEAGEAVHFLQELEFQTYCGYPKE